MQNLEHSETERRRQVKQFTCTPTAWVVSWGGGEAKWQTGAGTTERGSWARRREEMPGSDRTKIFFSHYHIRPEHWS